MKENVGDVHSCIYRTPTDSFMYLSSLATWRTAILVPFHRLDPAAQQRVVPWPESYSQWAVELDSRHSPSLLGFQIQVWLLCPWALLCCGDEDATSLLVTGPGLVGKLPKLAGPGAEGIQWIPRSWMSRGPVPRRRRGWQRSWYFLGDEGLGLAGRPASAWCCLPVGTRVWGLSSLWTLVSPAVDEEVGLESCQGTL